MRYKIFFTKITLIKVVVHKTKTNNDNFEQDQVETQKTEVKRKVSFDRPTEPTYPWRRPSHVDEVDRVLKISISLSSLKIAFTDNLHYKQDETQPMIIDDEPFVPRRRVSVDRPTEPTYPWRKPSPELEVDKLIIIILMI